MQEQILFINISVQYVERECSRGNLVHDCFQFVVKGPHLPSPLIGFWLKEELHNNYVRYLVVIINSLFILCYFPYLS